MSPGGSGSASRVGLMAVMTMAVAVSVSMTGMSACTADPDPSTDDGGQVVGPVDDGGSGGRPGTGGTGGAGGGGVLKDAGAQADRPAADRPTPDARPADQAADITPTSATSCAANTDCPAKQYCHFPSGRCLKASAACQKGFDVYCGDYRGICIAIPPMCSNTKHPVCGCDAKTYDNECLLGQAGVSPASRDHSCEAY